MHSWLKLIIFSLLLGHVCGGADFERLSIPRFTRNILTGVNVSASSLINSLPSILKNGYGSDQHIFSYYDSSVASKMARFSGEFDVEDVVASHIFSVDSSIVAPSRHYYYSGNMMQTQFTALQSKLNITNNVRYLIKDNHILRKVTANIWIGMAGVLATAHYDTVYNVYAHFVGVKKFRLLPPAAVHELQVHGRMHPYACQSRLKHVNTGELFDRRPFCVTCTCVTDFPSASVRPFNTTAYKEFYRKHAIEITMHPGDVLMIPPFWFHEVEAQTAALSVSLWWDARELDVMDNIYALPLPLESEWETNLIVTAGEVFASRLLCAVTETVRQSVSEVLVAHAEVDATQVLQSFSPIRVLQLITVRYKEDWAHRNGVHLPAATPLTLHQDADISGLAQSTWLKIDAASAQRATIFVDGFLSEENFVLQSSLFPDNNNHTGNMNSADASADESSASATCSTLSTTASVVTNQLAVLSIKLTDYIEDVFLQVAGMVKAKQCEESVDVTRVCPHSSELQYELAVELLLDWVNKIV